MKMPTTLLEKANIAAGAGAGLGGAAMLVDGVDAQESPGGHPITGALLGAGTGALLGGTSKALKRHAKKAVRESPEFVGRISKQSAAKKQALAAQAILKDEPNIMQRANDLVAEHAATTSATADLDKLINLATLRKTMAEAAAGKPGVTTDVAAALASKKEQALKDLAAATGQRDALNAALAAKRDLVNKEALALQTAKLDKKDARLVRLGAPQLRKDLASATERKQLTNAAMLAGGGALLGGVGGSFYDNPF